MKLVRRAGLMLAMAVGCATLSIANVSYAQVGSPLSSNPMMHQSRAIQSGIDDIQRRADKETAPRTIKDVKKGMEDADPNVRVSSLNKLRYLQEPETNDILLSGLADSDTRVKIKAIDLLGARQTTDAVPAMSQYLFLRSTEAVVRVHLVAALGRIGDARAALPVMQFLQESKDERSRGTAVFALGEIGDARASDLLTQVATDDSSTMVRRLAQEAIEKVEGEIPSNNKKVAEASRDKRSIPTDERLSKLRKIDAELHKVR